MNKIMQKLRNRLVVFFKFRIYTECPEKKAPSLIEILVGILLKNKLKVVVFFGHPV